jgi:acyl-CoA-binding protein|tara:strand:+ start:339 stop:551 length:213 start_codon:yes stop_codon:yes gene_type:complete
MNKEDLKQLIISYKQVFTSDHGKKVLEDLEKRCSFNATTHVKGDSHESAFLEGTRSVVLFIKNMLNKKGE